MSYKQKVSIKSWAEADRPREKLLLKGRASLSDAELLAILIGSGNREESAVDLCKRILNEVGNDLSELSLLGIQDLMKFKGIGEAKALSIAAALELGRRRKANEAKQKAKITCSNDAFQLLNEKLEDLPIEEFYAIFLNRANKVIKLLNISKGGVSGTVVDPRMVLKPAIECTASGIILGHNHPSGNLKPSKADIDITRKIAQAAQLLDINVLDHIIIGNDAFYSFSDEGLI